MGWESPPSPQVGKTLILGPRVATKPGTFNSPEPLPLLAYPLEHLEALIVEI